MFIYLAAPHDDFPVDSDLDAVFQDSEGHAESMNYNKSEDTFSHVFVFRPAAV